MWQNSVYDMVLVLQISKLGFETDFLPVLVDVFTIGMAHMSYDLLNKF